MADLDKLYQALDTADKAGSEEDVRDLTAMIKAAKAEPAPRAPKPPEPKETTGMDVAKGVGELGLSMATGALAQPIAGAVGAVEAAGKGLWRGGKALATGGSVGDALDSVASEAADTIKKIQGKMTYAPKTETGKEISGAVAKPFEMASSALGDVGETVGGIVGPKSAIAGRVLGENAIDAAGSLFGAGALVKGLKGARAVKPILSQEQDAAIRASKDGYIPPPTQADPSMTNKVLSTVANADKLADDIAVKNATNTTRLAKEDIGLKPDQFLNAEEVGKVKANAEKAYSALQAVTDVNLSPNGALRTALHAADKPTPSVARAKEAAPEYYRTPEFERIKAEVLDPQAQHTPASIMVHIADLRADASKLAKRAGARPEDFREAMAMRNVATALEDFLERKLTDSVYVGGDATMPGVKTPLGLPSPARPTIPGPQGKVPMGQMPMKDGGLLAEKSNAARQKLIDDWRAAREILAKVHNIEESTNLQTGHLDPAKLKKLRDNGAPLSGNLSKIVDAHEAMGDVVKNVERGNKTAIRAGDSSVGQAVMKAGHGVSAAALGAGVGGAVGATPGAAIGGAAGIAIPLAVRKAMATKLYQKVMVDPSPTNLQQLKKLDPALAAKAAAALASANVAPNRNELPPRMAQ
jgi:hypothetical protein